MPVMYKPGPFSDVGDRGKKNQLISSNSLITVVLYELGHAMLSLCNCLAVHECIL